MTPQGNMIHGKPEARVKKIIELDDELTTSTVVAIPVLSMNMAKKEVPGSQSWVASGSLAATAQHQ